MDSDISRGRSWNGSEARPALAAGGISTTVCMLAARGAAAADHAGTPRMNMFIFAQIS